MNYFFEIHKDIPREGPGDNETTKQAFEVLKLDRKIKLLDIGCGPGMQSIQLAKVVNGKVLATDVHNPFLDKLRKKVIEQNLSHKIDIENMSMFDIKVEEESQEYLV